MSDEGGRNQVYVSAFPAEASIVPVPTEGGRAARWSRDGGELLFLSDDAPHGVPVHTRPSLQIGMAVALVARSASRGGDFDVASDGRFLAVVRTRFAAQQAMTMIVNWPGSLSALK